MRRRLDERRRKAQSLARVASCPHRQHGTYGMKSDFSLPFGGYKQSGIGREGGAQGLMHYLETRAILLDAAGAQGD